MIKKFWTITQKNEIEDCCREYMIPQCVVEEIFRIIHILDDNYGVGRELQSDGGCVALIVKEQSCLDKYEEILKEYHLKRKYLEIRDIFPISEEKEWYSDLYIVTNDYGITIIYPHVKQ